MASKAWREKNKERLRQADRAYYLRNRERKLSLDKKRQHAGPDKERDRRYKRKYGITVAQYDAMLTQQGGVCAVCKQPPKKLRLHVDHDHKDGRVRGLLCYYCNRRVVGRLTLENARKVVAYLEKDFDGRKIET